MSNYFKLCDVDTDIIDRLVGWLMAGKPDEMAVHGTIIRLISEESLRQLGMIHSEPSMRMMGLLAEKRYTQYIHEKVKQFKLNQIITGKINDYRDN